MILNNHNSKLQMFNSFKLQLIGLKINKNLKVHT